jgi:Ca2+/Na+ antiporter
VVNFYLFAFLFLSLLIGLLHLSRYEVTANILYLVLAYCFVHAQDSVKSPVSSFKPSRFTLHAFDFSPRTSSFRLLLPLAAIALLFLFIDLFLRKSAEFAQANRWEGFLYHLYWYIASPLAALNDFLSKSTSSLGWAKIRSSL